MDSTLRPAYWLACVPLMFAVSFAVTYALLSWLG